MNIQTTYQSKDKLAEDEIRQDGIALALLFKTQKGFGILLATNAKSDLPKFKPIGFHIDGVDSAPFTLIASGHRRDFSRLVEGIEEYVRTMLSALKHPLALSSLDALEIITEIIGDQYDHVQRRAFAIDCALISAINGNLEMTRVNYSGEPLKCERFVVLGGLQRIPSQKKPLRKVALQMLLKIYKDRLPPKKEIVDLAKKILSLERGKGEMKTETLEMDTLPENLKRLSRKNSKK